MAWLTPLRLTTVQPCSSCAAAASLLLRASSASKSSVQSSRRFLSTALPGKHALCASTSPAHNHFNLMNLVRVDGRPFAVNWDTPSCIATQKPESADCHIISSGLLTAPSFEDSQATL